MNSDVIQFFNIVASFVNIICSVNAKTTLFLPFAVIYCHSETAYIAIVLEFVDANVDMDTNWMIPQSINRLSA